MNNFSVFKTGKYTDEPLKHLGLFVVLTDGTANCSEPIYRWEHHIRRYGLSIFSLLPCSNCFPSIGFAIFCTSVPNDSLVQQREKPRQIIIIEIDV